MLDHPFTPLVQVNHLAQLMLKERHIGEWSLAARTAIQAAEPDLVGRLVRAEMRLVPGLSARLLA
jgi:hypothetical protein